MPSGDEHRPDPDDQPTKKETKVSTNGKVVVNLATDSGTRSE
jgi:hypothetical protein